ncbi:MAG TPA: energy-coupling factor transporter transmembrane component T [Armatimonadota bacterium]|nr:energy-coupling factor transporter transmembrane component T [Armatimonadota bacterium]
MTPGFRPDARVTLALLLVGVLVTVLTPFGDWARLRWEALLVLLALVAGRTPPRWLLGRLALLLPFLLLALVSVPFQRPGVGPAGGWSHATFFLARALVSFGWLAAAFRFMAPAELLDALSRLRLPPIFVTVTALTLRYLAVLEDEAGRMLRAREARGMPPEVARRAQVAGAMVGSLFIRSLERSDRVSRAMQARGFTGLLPRPEPHPLLPADLALLLTGLALHAAVVLASWHG